MSEETYSIVIPAAGNSIRFAAAGYRGPKALVKFRYNDEFQTMIEHVAQRNDGCIVVCKRADFNMFKRNLPHFFVRPIESTEGQAHTVFQGIWDLVNKEYLIVNWDCAFEDGLFDRFVTACREKNAEMGTVVFNNSRAGEDGRDYVDQVPFFTRGARQPISPYAVAGAFYFKSRASFSIAYKNLPRPPQYISQMFGRVVGVHFAYEIDRNQVHEWGTPEDLVNDPAVTLIEQREKLR